MDVRAIRTEEDHAWALAEIETVWGKAEPGTPEGDRFEALSTLIGVSSPREPLSQPLSLARAPRASPPSSPSPTCGFQPVL
jgi:hypothetical protein